MTAPPSFWPGKSPDSGLRRSRKARGAGEPVVRRASRFKSRPFEACLPSRTVWIFPASCPHAESIRPARPARGHDEPGPPPSTSPNVRSLGAGNAQTEFGTD